MKRFWPLVALAVASSCGSDDETGVVEERSCRADTVVGSTSTEDDGVIITVTWDLDANEVRVEDSEDNFLDRATPICTSQRPLR